MNKHTQGKWKLTKTGNNTFAINGIDNTSIVVVQQNNSKLHHIPSDEIEANAKLIASAPVMLNRLKQLKADINNLLDTVLRGKEVSDTFVQSTINEIEKTIKNATQ